MPQTSQSAQQGAARAGTRRGHISHFEIDGQGVAEVAIKAGYFVSRGTATDQRKLPTTSNEVLLSGLGFALLDTAHGSGSVLVASPAASTEYQIGDPIPVVRKGPGFFAVAGEALAIDDPVFVCYGSTGRGKVYNDAGSGGLAASQLYGAKVTKAAAADGDPVLIELNLIAGVGPTGPIGATGPSGGPTGASGATGPTGPTGPA